MELSPLTRPVVRELWVAWWPFGRSRCPFSWRGLSGPTSTSSGFSHTDRQALRMCGYKEFVGFRHPAFLMQSVSIVFALRRGLLVCSSALATPRSPSFHTPLFTQCHGFFLCPPSHPISSDGGAMGSVVVVSVEPGAHSHGQGCQRLSPHLPFVSCR